MNKKLLIVSIASIIIGILISALYFNSRTTEQEKYYAQQNRYIQNEKDCTNYALIMRESLAEIECSKAGYKNIDSCSLSDTANERLNKDQTDAFNRCLSVKIGSSD